MTSLALPTPTADFTSYAFDAAKIYDKATSLYISVNGRVGLIGRRYCRPAVTFDGSSYSELNGFQLEKLINDASEVIGWVQLGGFAEYQNVKLK